MSKLQQGVGRRGCRIVARCSEKALFLWYSLRPLDIAFLRAIHEKVNIVPVIGKADCLTPAEVQHKKEKVRRLTLLVVRAEEMHTEGNQSVLNTCLFAVALNLLFPRILDYHYQNAQPLAIQVGASGIRSVWKTKCWRPQPWWTSHHDFWCPIPGTFLFHRSSNYLFQLLWAQIRQELTENRINIYEFPECDSDEDEEFKAQDAEMKVGTGEATKVYSGDVFG